MENFDLISRRTHHEWRRTGLSQRDDMDLKKLNDDELELLERLLEKAAGKLVGDVVPPFRIEFMNAAEPAVDANDVER